MKRVVILMTFMLSISINATEVDCPEEKSPEVESELQIIRDEHLMVHRIVVYSTDDPEVCKSESGYAYFDRNETETLSIDVYANGDHVIGIKTKDIFEIQK